MTFAPTVDGNLETIERLMDVAREQGADAALFPECALTGYRYDFKRLNPAEVVQALRRLGELASKYRINLLAGAPVFRRGRLCNALVVFDRRGRIVSCYAKCHLTEVDRRYFAPGNAVSLFRIEGVWATAVICHERRYPELVRLAVMAGARIVFHPNAGLDSLAVSRAKRDGLDGIPVRAFENAIPYVFANSVGPQGGGKWSAGDSKIVAPDGECWPWAGNQDEAVIVADVDLRAATGIYALQGMRRPRFLAPSMEANGEAVKSQATREPLQFDLPPRKTK